MSWDYIELTQTYDTQIAKTLKFISIAHWSSRKVLDRCLIDVNTKVFLYEIGSHFELTHRHSTFHHYKHFFWDIYVYIQDKIDML